MRSQALDILRGVAILLVLGHHAMVRAPEGDRVAGAVLGAWQTGGWMGVDLFFVLSGFLVSGLLFKEYMVHGDVQLGRFLVRRGLKIYPAFYAFLAVMLLFAVSSQQVVDWPGFACEALFIQNYGSFRFAHTWSLAIEEHFYLLLCLFFSMRLRQQRQHPFAPLPYLFVCIAISCLAGRLAMAHWPYDKRTHLFPTHLRLDALSFGVLISYLYYFYPDSLARLANGRRLLFLVTGIALVSPCFFLDVHQSAFVHTAGLTLNYLGWGCVLLAALYWWPVSSAAGRPVRRALATVGFYSYSIYLWHLAAQDALFAVLLNVRRGVPLPYPVALAVYVAAALLLGTVMAKLVERPFLRLRDRWFASRGKPLALAVPRPQPAT